MWPQNRLTERLNIQWPIFQAPMGGVSTSALAAAVSNSGGVGGLGMWGLTSEEAERLVAGFQQMSGGCLNINYPLWENPAEVSEEILERQKKLQKIESIWLEHAGIIRNSSDDFFSTSFNM